jgi:hypothetical protein
MPERVEKAGGIYQHRAVEIDLFVDRIGMLEGRGEAALEGLAARRQAAVEHFQEEMERANSYYSCLAKLVKAAL